MFKFFISSDAATEQTERFTRLNAHVPDLVRSVGVDVQGLDVQAMQQMNLISAECLFTPAAFAQALSHVSLWGNVAQHQTAAHVFAGNAVLCANFEAESTRILASLPQDWDFVLWGNAPGATLQLDILPDLALFTGAVQPPYSARGAAALSEMDVTSLAFPLMSTQSVCGYAISPSGADKLIKACLPLTSTTVPAANPHEGGAPAQTLEQLMSLHYSTIKAYACVPPLCMADAAVPAL
ncbi:MAG: glycosyl transferase [Acetobacter okinawensis]|uniref:glycosyl transferase n=1 Tax=Acetobacter okinawensis TaxID=1076594 RepID=UPI0039E8AF36